MFNSILSEIFTSNKIYARSLNENYSTFYSLLTKLDKQTKTEDHELRKKAIDKIADIMIQVADEHHQGNISRDEFQQLVNQFNPRHYYDYKIITKRVPELTKSAKQVKAGKMSHEEYQKIIDKHKPISEYGHIPEPATYSEMEQSLTIDKRSKLAQDVPEGEVVSIRLDIPAYTQKGTWVPTIHKGKSSIAHRSTTVLKGDIKFLCGRDRSLAIATHSEDKGPYATIKGPFVNKTPEEAKVMAEEALKSKEWVQVGMDPERHSYFYDRRTQQPIISGSEVIQIGPLVLVKDPKYDDIDAIDNRGNRKYPY